MQIKFLNRSKHALPEYKTSGSSGMDVRANLDHACITLEPHKTVLIPTGLYLEIPQGYEVQIRARSGLALKHGVSLANGIGTIDSDYRGEVGVILINMSDTPFEICDGDRIAQMVVARVEKMELVEVDSISQTERGAGGYGHTGR